MNSQKFIQSNLLKILPMKRMLILFICLSVYHKGKANDIAIGPITLVNQDISAGPNNASNFTFVNFNLSWENSWRTDIAPNNWDAAWVFIKYRIAGGLWQHAHLNDTGHVLPIAAAYHEGLLHPDSAFNNASNPCLGVFIYRAATGAGTLNLDDVKLRWNYGINGVNDTDLIEIQVFAIEMVYVPQGAFYVGSGGNESGAFYTYPGTTTPFLISNEGVINVGATNGYMNYASSLNVGDGLGPIPDQFPKGYNSFYAMKYELSQNQYVDFLNTLTYEQQLSRASMDATTLIGDEVLYTTLAYRNSIVVQTVNFLDSIPASFACDYNHNLIFNEPNDGQWLACNYLSWADIASYLDWSALRPMTEFEFEKLARGTISPVANEYAWGNLTISSGTTFLNTATALESFSNVGANVVYNAGNTQGPVRVGAFANDTTTRAESGAGYYGAMELSGNLHERTITIGKPEGRVYNGIHGNGQVDNTGNFDVSNWPATDAIGAGFRGGSFSNGTGFLKISARNIASLILDDRGQNDTGRGVRSVP